jgi:hypothetical protein
MHVYYYVHIHKSIFKVYATSNSYVQIPTILYLMYMNEYFSKRLKRQDELTAKNAALTAWTTSGSIVRLMNVHVFVCINMCVDMHASK